MMASWELRLILMMPLLLDFRLIDLRALHPFQQRA